MKIYVSNTKTNTTTVFLFKNIGRAIAHFASTGKKIEAIGIAYDAAYIIL